jgi:hypothetical protein
VCGDRALGGADVGDHGARRGGGQCLIHERWQGPDRGAGEHGIGAVDRLGDRSGRAIDRTPLESGLQDAVVRIEARDLSAAGSGSEAYRASNQPDSKDR